MARGSRGCGFAQAKRRHVGKPQRPSKGLRDMTQSIGAFIAEARRIRGTADSKGIEYEEEGAAHASGPMRRSTGAASGGGGPIV